MAVETELKLRIASNQLTKLKRHKLIKLHTVSRSLTRRVQSIYYDTQKLELHNTEMALRLRHAGRQWLQTLKGGGLVQAGLHQRNEWEIPVNRAALDFTATQVVEWDELLQPSLRKKLRPVFITDFSRNSRMLKFHGAHIELCIDQGEVRTEQRRMPFCELELELKSGKPEQLFELALAILEVVPFELEMVSKAEQGYRLLNGYTEHPSKAVASALARTDTLADALKKLVWSCLQHFQNNLHGAMHSDDSEYLHQMRVALRRLRVVLRMAEKVRGDRQLAELKKSVSALCVALGEIREWDVFIAQIVQPMCKRMVGNNGLRVLLAASERQRAACYAALRGVAQTRERQRLLLRFAIWMNGNYWISGWQQAEVQKAQDFSTQRLRQLAERFARSERQLNTFDAARLHALRIIAKKLRYSVEFFAALYDKRKTRSFLSALSKVQDVLGQINDIAVAHWLLDGLAADTVLTAQQNEAFLESITLCRGWIAHDLSRQFIVLRKTIQSFKNQDEFWKNK